MTAVEYTQQLQEQRASAQRQLAYIAGGEAVFVNGADRTGFHKAILERIITYYDRLLDNA